MVHHLVSSLVTLSGQISPFFDLLKHFGFTFETSRVSDSAVIHQLEIDKIQRTWDAKSDVLIKQTAFIQTYGAMELERLDKNIILSYLCERKLTFLREISTNSYFPLETRTNAANAQIQLCTYNLELSQSSLASLKSAYNITFDFGDFEFPALN